MRASRTCLLGAFLAGSMIGPAAFAASTINVTIVGDVATAAIEVDDGVDSYSATLRLSFQQPQNLTAACLGIDAELLDAGAIAALDARLPDPAGQQIDPDFPVRIVVEPPPGCGLSFVNEVSFELHTTELNYTPFSPYRLVKAPIGGAFADITAAVESGSIRARGSGGAFSEFAMVQDLSQDHALDAEGLFDELSNELDDPDIALTARSTLEADLAVARGAFDSNQIADARTALAGFESDLRALAGVGVDNDYDAGTALPSEVGELLGISGALGFRLGRLDGVP